MGMLDRMALVERARNGESTMREALQQFLSTNFYPPLSTDAIPAWVEVILTMIERFQTDQNLDYDIDNPMCPGETISACKIAEDLRLGPFLAEGPNGPFHVLGKKC